jgi:hypothetical protein
LVVYRLCDLLAGNVCPEAVVGAATLGYLGFGEHALNVASYPGSDGQRASLGVVGLLDDAQHHIAQEDPHFSLLAA